MMETIPNQSVTKNRCEVCNKFLLLHNKIMSCETCKGVVHGDCAKYSFEFNNLLDCWQCQSCIIDAQNRYNPFGNITHDKYDPVHLDESDDIGEIAKVHQSCRYFDVKQFNSLIKSISNMENKTSFIFNNIDGNATNFEGFTAELSQYHHRFSFIGIAETNIDQEHGDLYTIPGYRHEYGNKIPNKDKGTGIALYVNSNISYNRIEKYSQCSPNLETLFVTTTNSQSPITIGVVYRPPSGSLLEAMNEFDRILCDLPNKNVSIMGDFNINLFARTPNVDKFDSSIYSNSLIPLISLASHHKPS